MAIAALGVSASSASASSDVWLWACHAPSGDPLGNGLGDSSFGSYGEGCQTKGGLDAGGMRGELLRGADGNISRGEKFATLKVPTDTQLTGVQLARRTTGVVAGVGYSATALGTALAGESSSGADVPGATTTVPVDPGSVTTGYVQLKLACVTAGGCPAAGPAALDVSSVGLKVREAGEKQAPTFAVGGTRSPAAVSLTLDVQANDVGVGLKGAEAYIEGLAPPGETAFPTATNCHELTPTDATVDLPLDNDCKHFDNVRLDVNLKVDGVPDGMYTLVVRVSDWAGNVTEQRSPIEIANNVNLGQSSQTLSIGTSNTATPNPAVNPSTTTNASGKSGVAGQSSQNCTTPRLSFSLSQKPMRITKGVPVLQSTKRYRFTGRLTCVINGKRRSAPKRARVDIFNKVGKKTLSKRGITVGSGGKLSVILSYTSSRTVIFRFTNTDSKRSQVSIKIKVEKKKKSKR